jgi:hypothetical protein
MQCQVIKPTGRCENQATDPLIVEIENGERKIISVCESCAAQHCVNADEGDSPDADDNYNPYLLSAQEIERTLALRRLR